MKLLSAALLSSAILLSGSLTTSGRNAAAYSGSSPSILGFRDAAAEQATESRFLAVPESKLAEEHLRILTKAPHMAGTSRTKRRLITSRKSSAPRDLTPRSSSTKSG